MLGLINTILAVIPVKSKWKLTHTVKIAKGFLIEVHGDLKNCKKVLVLGHGMGGSRKAGYVVSLANRFVHDAEVAVITFDNPGTFSNKKFSTWCVSSKGQNNFYYEIVDYISSANPKCSIYLSGFSGGGGLLLSYLTDTQNVLNTSNRDKVKYSFLISPPTLAYKTQLMWCRDNTFIAKYISPCVAYQGVVNGLLLGDVKKCVRLLTAPFDIVLTNDALANGAPWYDALKNDAQKLNATIVVSKSDPVIPWTGGFTVFSKLEGYKLMEFPSGGHCGFLRLDGKRDHEELIYAHITKEHG